MTTDEEYVPLNRGDLRRFDGEAQKLLLWAQEQGARLRLTKRGHCFVYAPDGQGSACVPPNLKMANRSAQNARASVARMLK